MFVVAALEERGYMHVSVRQRNASHPILNAVRHDGRVEVSGQIPFDEDGNVIAGKVGGDISLAEAKQAAEICVVACLYAAGSVINLNTDIKHIIEIMVYVNCAPGFTELSEVANGASKFLTDVFGYVGWTRRAAIGVAELPYGAAVEVTMVIAV